MFSFLAPRMLVQRRTANKSKAKSERDWKRDTERPPWEYGSINFPSGGFEVQLAETRYQLSDSWKSHAFGV